MCNKGKQKAKAKGAHWFVYFEILLSNVECAGNFVIHMCILIWLDLVWITASLLFPCWLSPWLHLDCILSCPLQIEINSIIIFTLFDFIWFYFSLYESLVIKLVSFINQSKSSAFIFLLESTALLNWILFNKHDLLIIVFKNGVNA